MTRYSVRIEGNISGLNRELVETAIDRLADLVHANDEFDEQSVGVDLATGVFDLELVVDADDAPRALLKVVSVMEPWKAEAHATLRETHLVPQAA